MKPKTVSMLLVLGSVIILPWFLIDASTNPKYTSVALLASLIVFHFRQEDFLRFRLIESKVKWLFFALTFGTIALAFSPISLTFNAPSYIFENLFGASGRMLGVFTLLSFLILGIWIYLRNEKLTIDCNFATALIWSASLVSIYHSLQFLKIDFVDWEAWYSKPSSFLGNPNFVSAFVGIGVVSLFRKEWLNYNPYSFKLEKRSKGTAKHRNLLIKFHPKALTIVVLTFILYIFVLITNGSIQGFLIALSGLTIRLMTSTLRSRNLFSVLIMLILFLTVVGILSSQNQLIQIREISTRVVFWKVGYEAFLSSPLLGLGTEGIKREYDFLVPRELLSELNLQYNFRSDSSHNLLVDLMASGGLLLFLPYFPLFVYTITSFLANFNRKNDNSNYWFALFASFLMYTLISPPQLTILLWGFIALFMTLVSIEASRDEKSSGLSDMDTMPFKEIKTISLPKKKIFRRALQVILAGTLFVGGITPSFSDFRFRESIYTQNLSEIDKAARAFPTNQERIYYAARIICSNKDWDRTNSLLDFGSKRYPNNLNLLQLRFRLPLTEAEREQIKIRIAKINPGNDAYSRVFQPQEQC